MHVKRVINTIKYMNKRQIVSRIGYEVYKRKRKKIKEIKSGEYNNNYIFKEFKNIKEINNIEKRKIGNNILKNKFQFLNNLEYDFGNNINWDIDPFKYRLWNFNLNYFDFLDILAYCKEYEKSNDFIEKGVNLIIDWISKNEDYNPNNWDPYVVSKRIYNWINFISYYSEYIPELLFKKINNSIFTQGYYLESHIEYYLDANHIIMDAKGIIFFAVYAQDYKLLDRGLQVLIKEYKRQVLLDGGHYERSPSYQVEVLSHYVECFILLEKNKIDKIKFIELKQIIFKMSEYLNLIIKPDGNIPLVNDSSLDYPMKANDLLQLSSCILEKRMFRESIESEYVLLLNREKKDIYNKIKNEMLEKKIGIINLKETGYYLIKDFLQGEELYILFDCGDCGPDYNLGHAHADNLNILCSLGKKDLIVDSGTYTYKLGEKRDYYRSTSAHNTLTIDNINSSDVWSGFRVAKRAKSKVLKINEVNNGFYISAYHDGYCKVLKEKIIHLREILYIKDKGILILDSLIGNLKNQHTGVINFNLSMECYEDEHIKINFEKYNEKQIFEDRKRSELFNIEKDCKCIKYKFIFDKSIEIKTMIEFDEDLEIKIYKNKIEWFTNGQLNVLKREKV